MIRTVVNNINETLKAILPDHVEYYGLTVQLTRDEKTFPAEMELSGEARQVNPDDIYDGIIYHRAENLTYEDQQRAYGDGYPVKVLKAKMFLAAFVRMNRLKLYPDEYVNLLTGSLPNTFSKEFLTENKILKCTVKAGGAELNSQSVFNSEYRGEAFTFPTDCYLVKLDYEIELSFDKNCAELCKPTTC